MEEKKSIWNGKLQFQRFEILNYLLLMTTSYITDLIICSKCNIDKQHMLICKMQWQDRLCQYLNTNGLQFFIYVHNLQLEWQYLPKFVMHYHLTHSSDLMKLKTQFMTHFSLVVWPGSLRKLLIWLGFTLLYMQINPRFSFLILFYSPLKHLPNYGAAKAKHSINNINLTYMYIYWADLSTKFNLFI